MTTQTTPSWQLDGKKVRLRAYCKEDIPTVLGYINDPEVKNNLSPGIALPYRLEDEQKWYENLGRDPEQSYSFAIETLDTKNYIGGCGYNRIDWKNSHAIVGIFIGTQWQNKDLGTDAMNLLVQYIFSEMSLNKIALNVFSFNARAIRSYEKCGFKIEGTLRQQIFRNGQFHDEIAMGLLRSEWLKIK